MQLLTTHQAMPDFPNPHQLPFQVTPSTSCTADDILCCGISLRSVQLTCPAPFPVRFLPEPPQRQSAHLSSSIPSQAHLSSSIPCQVPSWTSSDTDQLINHLPCIQDRVVQNWRNKMLQGTIRNVVKIYIYHEMELMCKILCQPVVIRKHLFFFTHLNQKPLHCK